MSGGVAYQQDQQNTMKKSILEKRWNFLRKAVRAGTEYIYDVTSPSTGTDNSDRTAGKEEIRRQLDDSGLFAERRPLLDVLHNIHHNVRYTGKYKGSDSYII